MDYRYVATTRTGFVRQLVQYLHHGYWFYVTGRVKPGKDPQVVDGKLLSKFGVPMSRQERWRRKKRGLANVHYLRCGDFWILCSTKGEHCFFEEHVKRDQAGRIARRYFRDARTQPVLFSGYSLCVKRGRWAPYRLREAGMRIPKPDNKYRVRVQISQRQYRELSGEFIELAKRARWTIPVLESMVYRLPYEPYAPVKQQLCDLVRRMNRARRMAGLSGQLATKRAVRYWMKPVKPFEVADEANTEAA